MAQTLADLVRDAREAKGLSQPALARLARLNVATIYRIETGQISRPHGKTVERIAKALGMRPSRLQPEDAPLPPTLLKAWGHSEGLSTKMVPRALLQLLNDHPDIAPLEPAEEAIITCLIEHNVQPAKLHAMLVAYRQPEVKR